MEVQAFISKSAVEALDVGILHRSPRPDEMLVNPSQCRPPIHRCARELGAIVADDGIDLSSFGDEPVEYARYPSSGQREIHLDSQALPGEIVDEGQDEVLRLKALVGDLTMRLELARERARALEAESPFPWRKSRD